MNRVGCGIVRPSSNIVANMDRQTILIAVKRYANLAPGSQLNPRVFFFYQKKNPLRSPMIPFRQHPNSIISKNRILSRILAYLDF